MNKNSLKLPELAQKAIFPSIIKNKLDFLFEPL